MAITLGKISEQIRRRYYGGSITADAKVDEREIQLLVIQALNALLKTESLGHDAMNEGVPAHALIANYSVTPVALDGTSTGQFTEESLHAEGFLSAWATSTDEPWTYGENWLIDYQEVTTTITSAIVSGAVQYTIVVSGFTLPPNVTTANLLSLLSDCPDTGYFQIDYEQDVLNFAGIGISDPSVTTTSLTFKYTPSLSSGSDTLLQNRVAATHTLLASSSSLSYNLQNFKCFSFDSNSSGSLAKITLPAMPLNHHTGKGVWRVYDPALPWADYIPTMAGVYALATGATHNTLAAALDAVVCYSWHDRYTLVFNRTISEMPASITVQLLIADLNTLTETDFLPIPPEMEIVVIQQVLQLLQGTYRKEDLRIDNEETIENGGQDNNR